MKKNSSQKPAFAFIAVSLLCLCFVAFCKERRPPEISAQEKTAYESYVRLLLPLVWTNDCSQLQASAYREELFSGCPWSEKVKVRLSNNEKKTCFTFSFQPATSNVTSATNFEYDFGRDRNNQLPPVHSLMQAHVRMREIAKLFGVTNLLDPTYYQTTDVVFTEGTWEHSSRAIINGYQTVYFSVNIRIMDTAGMPLCRWGNTVSYIPDNLPTNVVLTAEQARKKGEHYLKKYFPDTERLSQIIFKGSRLEYVRPNSKLIDPKKDAREENTRGPKDTRLAWVVYFNMPFERPIESSLPIYVDAETGEMLGSQ
jgi:hypothetical protein